VSILETYASVTGLYWEDEWRDLGEYSPRIGPIDWKQETFIHRYMNYLDEVALRAVLWVVTPLEVN